jgi:cation diffusion facilitator family transporter
MADHGSSAKAILYAFVANLGIALAKLAASLYTNSGSMLAEAIHSFADCGNQVLLFLGLKQSQKPPDAKHPLGYGKISYFWSFIVALLLFSMGGLFSMYEGWHKLHAPEPLNKAWVALLVLGVSVALEFGSLLGCLREIAKLRKGKSLGAWLKHTRNAELVVVLGEDVAALVGLVIAFAFVALAAATGNPVYDAVGSIAIGVILVCVSIFIAIRIKGLIVGRSAEDDLQEALRAEVASDPHIDAVLNAITMQMGPDVMLALKVRMRPGLTLEAAVESLNALEKRIKTKFPEVAWCFVEPDVAD